LKYLRKIGEKLRKGRRRKRSGSKNFGIDIK